MNTFGRLFRLSILGESHGSCVGILIDGCPAGLSITQEEFMPDLERRRGGKRSGTTARAEADFPKIESGLFQGKSSGAPLLITFQNSDVRSKDYDELKNTPRPGHADLTARQKFGGFNDYRGGGHFSGRLTAALVAAGVVAKKIIAPLNVQTSLIEAGGSCDIENSVESALQAGDSVGGVVECRAANVPAGLGEPFFDSLESALSHAVFSIPAVKGIEFGSGFAAARLRGSEMNDDIISTGGKTATNNAGGINGGISNGNELVFRVAVKPTSSIARAGRSIDLKTGCKVDLTVQGRHDACLALRVPVVVEAVTAVVLADFMLLAQNIERIRRE